MAAGNRGERRRRVMGRTADGVNDGVSDSGRRWRQAMAAGDGGRRQGGARLMCDGNNSNSNRQKRKQSDIPEQDTLSWGMAGSGSGGEQEERLRQP